jgi:hypothetical protein
MKIVGITPEKRREGVPMKTAQADFVQALEEAQTIAVKGILTGDLSRDWVELDHQISDILARFPLEPPIRAG